MRFVILGTLLMLAGFGGNNKVNNTVAATDPKFSENAQDPDMSPERQRAVTLRENQNELDALLNGS